MVAVVNSCIRIDCELLLLHNKSSDLGKKYAILFLFTSSFLALVFMTTDSVTFYLGLLIKISLITSY